MSQKLTSVYDLYDLNNKEFNSELYIVKVLQTLNLTNLISTNNRIIWDIQSIDYQRKCLLYDNYLQFESQTEIVSNIRDVLGKTEEDIEQLSSTMTEVKKLSHIASNLSKKHLEVIKSQDKLKVLKRMVQLNDYSTKLKLLVDNRQYLSAVQAYGKMKKVLSVYHHHQQLLSAEENLDKVIQDMIDTLSSRFEDAESTVEDLVESLELLRMLNLPAVKHCRNFLEVAKNRICAQLAALIRSPNAYGTTASSNLERCNNFLNSLLKQISMYEEVFVTAFRRNKEMENLQISRKMLSIFVDKMCIAYFDMFSTEQFEIDCGGSQDKELPQQIRNIYQKLVAINGIVESQHLERKTADMLYDYYRRKCVFVYQKLTLNFKNILADCKDFSTTSFLQHLDWTEVITNLEQMILSSFKSAIEDLKGFMLSSVMTPTECNFNDFNLRNLVVNDLLHPFLKQICNLLVEMSYENLSSEFVLLTAGLNTRFQESLCQSLVRAVESDFSLLQENYVPSAAKITLKMDFEKSFDELLKIFVESKTNEITRMIAVSMQSRDWMTSAEPSQVRSVAIRTIEVLKTVKYLLQQFTERSSNLLKSIVKASLKNCRELVRFLTLSTFGLQQWQVDLYYLKIGFRNLSIDNNFLICILDDIMASCVGRCIEPVKMSNVVVKTICYQSKSISKF